jgi:hypothetical protein
MHIKEVTLRTFDDVKIGDIVKPNPFVDWSDIGTYGIEIEDADGNDSLWMQEEMCEIDEEFTVESFRGIDNTEIQTNKYRYPRDLLLVKGVDYE